MNRRNALSALFAFLSLGAAARAGIALSQPSGKVHRVGVLAAGWPSTPSQPNKYAEIFIDTMRSLGYVEGKNLRVEWRFAEGTDRLPQLAGELAKLGVDVILTQSTPGALAAMGATKTIPIVFSNVTNPVGRGVVASLARPSGNITGIANFLADLLDKQFELLKATIPRLARVRLLGNFVGYSFDVPTFVKRVTGAGAKFGIEAGIETARTAQEIEQAFAAMARQRVGAVIVAPLPVFDTHQRLIFSLALKYRLPVIYPHRHFVKAGGLMSYGDDPYANTRRAVEYVDKILKGAKPGDLPVEQPTKVELVINRQAAKAIGLALPSEVLLRADEVIE